MRDLFDLRIEEQTSEKDRESVAAIDISEAEEKAFEQGIESCHGRSEDRNMTSPSRDHDSYPNQNLVEVGKGHRAHSSRRCSGSGAAGSDSESKCANQIQQSSDLWDLEHYLTERRSGIDPIYRYSQLTHVFGRFLHEGRGSEEELRGLRQRQTEVDSHYCAAVCEVCSLTWILGADGVISSK